MSDSPAENQIIEPAAFSRADISQKQSGPRLNLVVIAVSVVFLLLALVALFMFNARAVELDVQPEPDSLQIDGAFPTWELGGRHLMLPGNYQVTAEKTGYRALNTILTIGDAAEQNFTLTLSPLPGILTVKTFEGETEVSGAEVFIDQAVAGKTPLTIDAIESGSRELYIRHPRYLPVQLGIEIEGRRVEQNTAITLERAWADIGISSLPAGAQILVDGEPAGQTPSTLEIIQGERQIAITHPGYKRWETSLDVTAAMDMDLDEIVLTKSDGKLAVNSEPAGANITIGGIYQGQTPLAVAVAPGENYELIATRAGYQSQRRLLSVEPEQDQVINLRLKPVTGLVKLNVAPGGATLFVDGRELGEPNRTLELTASNHTIRIELPGYASFETNVLPQPGFSQQLNVTLLTEEAAKVSAIPQRLTTAQGDVLRFVLPDSLTMGAGRREPGRRSNEIEKSVELTRSFYISEKEISNAAFKAFDPGHDSGMLGRALLSEDDRPVVNVSWEKAVRYCNWLSEQDNLDPAYELVAGRWQLKTPVNTGYRLPTEAEWAWVARYAAGPSPARFPWGDNMPPPEGAGNFADESAAGMVPYSIKGYRDAYRGPAPSGSFSPNELGLYDLAGNVSEWVHDYYSIDLSRETLVDPIGPDSGEYHTIRGSNYTHGRFSELRWTFRDYGSDARPDVGFRIVRYLE